jgi:hypothetical protein
MLFGLNILVICLFFSRKSMFPKSYIILLLANVTFLLIDELVANKIPFVASESGASSTRDLGRAVVQAIIWCAYMVKSRRVKATFVR